MRYFGGRQVSFAEAFPQIEAMQIEVTVSESISGFSRKNISRYSFDSPPPATIRCTGKCSDGKHDIAGAIRRAVLKGGGEVSEVSMCHGREPMGRGQSRSCTGSFAIKGSIQLREKKKDAEQADTPAP